MAGYTRQSAADIIANAVIRAAPVNAEYNAIRDAFAQATGHKHDGTSSEGAYVPLISDPSNTNKVVIDTANNRISFYSEVSSTAVEQVRIQDGAIVPVTDDDIDLGAVGAEFKDLYIDGIGYIDSVVITGGTIDDTVIGGTTPAAADFTTMDTTGNASIGGTFAVTGTSTFTGAISAGSLTTTGNSTHATVDINGGAIDGTIIGASSAAAGSFTTVSTSGQATLASADINGGTIDGAVIGGSSAQAITGTTITANTGFTGALTGNVTGNVTGNLTGDVTGDLTGDVTGNVTASTGTTTLNDLVVNGTVDFTSTALLNVSDPTSAQHAATKNYVDTNDALKLNLSGGTMSGDITMGGNTVTGLGTPSLSTDAATKGYVDTEVAALVDSAPGTLDTLNELAAALGDDPDFATTITTSIATKLPLAGGTMTGDITMGANAVTSTATPATNDTLTRKGYVDTQDALKLDLTGGTMSGAIAMGTSKITGLGDPTATQDAATKTYVDTADATKLNLSGGTMTGAIDMGANKITTTYTPTDNADLTTKTYVDGILGSATAAAASAAAAATSETNAATSETNAANSATAAAASYDDFDDRYLGAKASAPSVDNDGDALLTGALYWDTSVNELYVWNGSAWEQGTFTSGSFIANVVEDTTPQLGGDLDSNGNDILFGDDDKAIFGAGSDLQIYHNSLLGESRIYAFNNDLVLQSQNGIDSIVASNSGAAKLNYTGSEKLATTSTGIDVTGTVTADDTITVNGTTAEITLNASGTTNGVTLSQTSTAGILINNASQPLQIKGQGGVGASQPIEFYTGNDVKRAEIAGSTGDISFYEDTGTTAKFFWDASAESLGIGTSSPASALHVSGSGAEEIRITRTGGAGRTYSTSVGGSLEYNIRDENAGVNRLSISTAGNVGIGTTSPSVSLDIGDTDAVKLPAGTTAQRPTGANGMIRYNSDDGSFEGYAGGAWGAIGGGGDQQTATTTSTTQTAIATYTASSSLGIEITVVATDTVATERTITKLLVTHDGTTAVATEYGTVNTATAVATFDVDISGGNVRLLATAASANSTNFTANAVILA